MLFCRSINRDILLPALTYNTSGLLVQALVLKSLYHAICYLFKKLLSVFTLIEFNSKNNGPALLFKTICRCWNCFLSSVATDGKDGCGLKLEEFGPTFSCLVWDPCPNFVWYLHHDFAEALFVWVKVLPIIIYERGWGRENHRGRGGGSGLFFYIVWVGHYWNIKWKGVSCIFFIV